MGIPKRPAWENLKKQHSIGKGAVSGVNLGELLDAYHRADENHGRLEAIRPLGKLLEGARKYKAGMDKKNPAFAAVFKTKVLKEVEDLIDNYDKLANPVARLSQYLQKTRGELAKMGENPTQKEYDSFFSECVGGVGTAFGPLVKLDPQFADLQKMWDRCLALQKVEDDTHKRKTALTEIGTTTTKVIAEGNKRNLFKI